MNKTLEDIKSEVHILLQDLTHNELKDYFSNLIFGYDNLQQENKQLKDNWKLLKEWLNTFHKLSEFEQWEIVNKIKELEKSDSNE